MISFPTDLPVNSWAFDDDPETQRRAFPLVRWSPAPTYPDSKHLALATRGINGTSFYVIDDPVFTPFHDARRRGLRPCCCSLFTVSYHEEAARSLPRLRAAPLVFDPWSDDVNCMLVGGIYPHPERRPVLRGQRKSWSEKQRTILNRMFKTGLMKTNEYLFWVARLDKMSGDK